MIDGSSKNSKFPRLIEFVVLSCTSSAISWYCGFFTVLVTSYWVNYVVREVLVPVVQGKMDLNNC